MNKINDSHFLLIEDVMKMNKRKVFTILTIYILTLIIFIIIAELNTENFVRWYMETMDYGNGLIAMGPILIAETVYIFLILVIALVAKFLKIEENIKNIFYMLPIITIIIWMPIASLINKII